MVNSNTMQRNSKNTSSRTNKSLKKVIMQGKRERKIGRERPRWIGTLMELNLESNSKLAANRNGGKKSV